MGKEDEQSDPMAELRDSLEALQRERLQGAQERDEKILREQNAIFGQLLHINMTEIERIDAKVNAVKIQMDNTTRRYVQYMEIFDRAFRHDPYGTIELARQYGYINPKDDMGGDESGL